jgi:hypothetical protein
MSEGVGWKDRHASDTSSILTSRNLFFMTSQWRFARRCLRIDIFCETFLFHKADSLPSSLMNTPWRMCTSSWALVIHQLHTLSLPNVTLWLATDDFKDGEILEILFRLRKVSSNSFQGKLVQASRQSLFTWKCLEQCSWKRSPIAFHMEMSWTMFVKTFTASYAYYYGMHTAFPRKIWEAIGGYYTYNEVYDGWWG